MLDIKQDIIEGRYPPPTFNNRNHKVFGRRVFVLLDDTVLGGNIQYMFDETKESLLVYIDFAIRRNSQSTSNSKKMIIKRYIVSDGVDMDLFMKRIRAEIIDEPQLLGLKWSFNAESLV